MRAERRLPGRRPALCVGSYCDTMSSRYFVMLQLMTTSRSAAEYAECSRQSHAASTAKRERVLTLVGDATLVDSRQSLQVDVRVVPGRRHHLGRGDAMLRQLAPDALEARDKRRPVVAGRCLHQHPSVVHRHPQLLIIPSAQSFSVSTYKSSSARAGRPSERHDDADDAVLDLGRRERAPQCERVRVVADEVARARPPRRELPCRSSSRTAPDRPSSGCHSRVVRERAPIRGVVARSGALGDLAFGLLPDPGSESPGSTRMTRMPSRATSMRSASERPSSACFAPWYQPVSGVDVRP